MLVENRLVFFYKVMCDWLFAGLEISPTAKESKLEVEILAVLPRYGELDADEIAKAIALR